MAIEKSTTYTAYLEHGITFVLDVRENGIITLSTYWANSERMNLDELSLSWPNDLTRLGELFTLAGVEAKA
jgi:hypothetical protein